MTAHGAILRRAAVVARALLHREQWRVHVPYALRALSVGLLVTIVLCAPALLVQFFGANRLVGQFQHPGGFSTDLLNFVVPTDVQQVDPGASRVAARFSGNNTEQTGYLGLPLVLILA